MDMRQVRIGRRIMASGTITSPAHARFSSVSNDTKNVYNFMGWLIFLEQERA